MTTYVLLEQEAWFEDEITFVSTYLRPGESAIDVGANFGLYTTAMAQAVGPGGRIFAFEPASETAVLLRATVQRNHLRHVVVHQAAVSDHRGQARLQSGSSPELSAITNLDTGSSPSELVQLVTLDEDVPRSAGSGIALLKLDAEGHELQVGRGARQIIAEDEPLILFEIKHGPAFEYGFLEFLESMGWSFYRLAPGMNLLVPFTRNAVDGFQLNVFACSKRKAAELQKRGLLASCAIAPTSAAPRALTSQLYPFGQQPEPGTPYALALDHYASAQQTELEPGQRLGHMEEAFRQAQAAGRQNSLARRITTARIAADLGFRSVAVSALNEALPALTAAPFVAPDEPCLSPASTVGAPTANAEFFRIAALETFERLRAFSSLFSGAKSLPFVEYLCSQPGIGPEMHRRNQLLRMISGQKMKPQPSAKLSQESPANVNAWFWRGQ
jgi:FkbM family methyltransferase